jgi:S1-C subfamily serine protease
MCRSVPEYISAWRYRLLRIAVVVGMVWLSILIIAGSPPAAYADGMPGGNVSDPVVRAVDIAKPAVVRIITFLTGQLTVQFSATQNVTFRQGGNGYQIVLSGSGTFITAHGDILTADHVINPPRSDLDQFLQQQAAQDVATYMNQTLHVKSPITADQVAAELASGQLPSNTQYNTPRSRAYLSTDYAGPLNAPDVQSIPANLYAQVDRIEQQSSFNQKDVAIIHVSNMDDRAMVQLGNSSNVQQQDYLTIIGFPGSGDVSNNPTDLLTLSVINKVSVSAIKTTDTGAPVIQVSGNVEHGDSGGPALDNNGTIVGIVSFGSSNGSGSTSFLQASNSASALVQSLKLDTSPGRFQKAWQQAFADYASNAPGHWHKVQREFQQIAVQYPSFKAIKPYLDYTTTQAKTEKPVQPPQQTTQSSSTGSPVLNALTSKWAIIGAAVILLLVLLLFGGVVLRRRRGKQAPASLTPAVSVNRLQPVPTQTPAQSRPINPSQSAYGPLVNEGMAAFGAPMSQAPPRPAQQPMQPPAGQPQRFPPGAMPSQAPTFSTNSPTVPSNSSGALVPWPCGHMNRPVARYCSVCGEPAPQAPTIRKYEQ